MKEHEWRVQTIMKGGALTGAESSYLFTKAKGWSTSMFINCFDYLFVLVNALLYLFLETISKQKLDGLIVYCYLQINDQNGRPTIFWLIICNKFQHKNIHLKVDLILWGNINWTTLLLFQRTVTKKFTNSLGLTFF